MFHPEFLCSVSGITYDFYSHTGKLHMDRNASCDMRGCIKFFERIDPEVARINTYADNKPDTMYFKRSGKWEALLPGTTERAPSF